ncbi:hypothetical protein ACFL1N_07400 [Thermodesulfobacteriota bacterium]
MRIRLIIAVVLISLLQGALTSCVTTNAAVGETPVLQGNVKKVECDRGCLENYIDKYLEAMADNNPSLDLFTRNCKFTENGVQLPLGGEGLWYSMSGRGGYNFYIPDIETRQIAYIGTVKEGSNFSPDGKPENENIVAVAIRLKIDDNDKISEAEQLVMRPEVKLFEEEQEETPSRFSPTGEAVEKMEAPHEIFTEVIPEAERMSREELVKVADYYFEGLQRNDTKGYYPFTDDCVRYENGMLSTRECKKQFESGQLSNIVSRIRDRRFVAVDRERGIAFAFGFFDHVQINWTWQIAELFKIENGLIRRIEAVFLQCPYGMNSGWSSFEQGMSEEIQSIR